MWECTVPAGDAGRYSETLNVGNLRNIEGDRAVLRVISDSRPMEHAVGVQPNLEGGFDNYNRIWVAFNYKLNYSLNGRCIKKVSFVIVIGRSRDCLLYTSRCV